MKLSILSAFLFSAFSVSSVSMAHAAIPAVEGSWVANCVTPAGGKTISMTITFQGNHFDRNTVFWDDSTCQSQDFSDEKTGTFVLTDGSFGVAGAVALDLSCDATSNSAAGVVYNILLINGATLYMGDDSFSEDERPTTLSMGIPLQKQ